MNVNAQKFQSKKSRQLNRWPIATIERHSLSQPYRAASSLIEGAGNGPYHSMYRPKTVSVRAIFIAPTKLKNHPPVSTRKRYRVGQGTHV